ncbi:MAG: hypothetical protein J6R81_03095 [Alistipes sp.]|nr:hypothetical protein [Alistipes sp.]
MKNLLRIVALVVVVASMQSCTIVLSSSYGTNDLYRTDNREQIEADINARNEMIAARKARYEAEMAEQQNANVDYNSVLVTDYQTAYERRLYGFESPTYKLPSSYYSMATSEAMYYASAYDPAFYNVMVSGDQVWVEPKYITSMFGSWGATNVTFGLYSSPWMYGWTTFVDPFYYAWWGYPHYSWFDWNWTICYSSFYFGWGPSPFYPGYYPGFYPFYPGFYPHPPHPGHGPGHGPGPRPPHHPQHRPGGRDNHNFNGGSTHYTSPTSNRNYGGGASSSGRPTYSGSKSTGVYNGNAADNIRKPERNNNTQQGSRYNSGSNTSQQKTTQRSDNYRQSNRSENSHSTTTVRSNQTRSTGGFSGGGNFGSGSNTRRGGTTSTRR